MTLITLIILITLAMVVLMIIGLIFSHLNKLAMDKEQISRQKYKINYHSTTGCGSRR